MPRRRRPQFSRSANLLTPQIQALAHSGVSQRLGLSLLRNTLRQTPYADPATGRLISGIRDADFRTAFNTFRGSVSSAESITRLTRGKVPDIFNFQTSPFSMSRRFLYRIRVPVRLKTTGETLDRYVTITSDQMPDLESITEAAVAQVIRNPVESEVDIQAVALEEAYIVA